MNHYEILTEASTKLVNDWVEIKREGKPGDWNFYGAMPSAFNEEKPLTIHELIGVCSKLDDNEACFVYEALVCDLSIAIKSVGEQC